MKQYLIERHNEEPIKIEVPDDWKVTFGPVIVPKDKYQHQQQYALRFYETPTKQRAIFTNVVSFRDLSIQVYKAKMNWKKAMDGSDETVNEWVLEEV